MATHLLRRSFLLWLVPALAVAAAGPGFGVATAGRKATTHTVVIEGSRFSPSALTVKAGDSVMWLNKDLFPHTATARAVLGREPTAHDRQLAKALNFGLLYGMGAERLRTYAQDGYGVTLSEEEAVQFRQRFFQTYPGLRAWQHAQPEGEVTTLTLSGRPRHGVSRFTEKLNSPVQGTGADILKGALARLWNDRAVVPSAALVLAIHDEIVCEVDADEAER